MSIRSTKRQNKRRQLLKTLGTVGAGLLAGVNGLVPELKAQTVGDGCKGEDLWKNTRPLDDDELSALTTSAMADVGVSAMLASAGLGALVSQGGVVGNQDEWDGVVLNTAIIPYGISAYGAHSCVVIYLQALRSNPDENESLALLVRPNQPTLITDDHAEMGVIDDYQYQLVMSAIFFEQGPLTGDFALKRGRALRKGQDFWARFRRCWPLLGISVLSFVAVGICIGIIYAGGPLTAALILQKCGSLLTLGAGTLLAFIGCMSL